MDGLRCESPLCTALIPLTPAEETVIGMGGTVTRYCDAAALPHLIDPCDPSETNDKVCRTPACILTASGGQSCEEPRCVALIPLTPAEQDLVDQGVAVTRYCNAPPLPSFPVIIPEPRGILVELTALFALGALAARCASQCTRRSRPRG
jgi:hypothetical protein